MQSCLQFENHYITSYVCYKGLANSSLKCKFEHLSADAANHIDCIYISVLLAEHLNFMFVALSIYIYIYEDIVIVFT